MWLSDVIAMDTIFGMSFANAVYVWMCVWDCGVRDVLDSLSGHFNSRFSLLMKWHSRDNFKARNSINLPACHARLRCNDYDASTILRCIENSSHWTVPSDLFYRSAPYIFVHIHILCLCVCVFSPLKQFPNEAWKGCTKSKTKYFLRRGFRLLCLDDVRNKSVDRRWPRTEEREN